MPERNDTLGFLTSEEIVFPDTPLPSYVFDRDCISFPALLGSKPLECLVTAEFLMTRFHAPDSGKDSLSEAFEKNKDEIHEIARVQIENGWVDEEQRVFITTRFTRLKVKFGRAIHASD